MGLQCKMEEYTLRRFIANGFITSAVVQLFLFLVLTVSWRIIMEPPPLESSTLCVTCNDIKQTYPYNHTQHFIDAWRQTYNDSVCCGPIRTVMELRMHNEMTKQVFENKQSNPSLIVGELFITDCEWKGIKAPKAKLVGVVNSIQSDSVQDHSKLRWNKNGLTFTADKLIHLELEGEIFIRTPGYYIVSSTLNVNATGTDNTTTIFSHSLNLLSNNFGTTSVLMQRQKSIKESDHVIFTSFISAVFKLHIYDRISVYVSNPIFLAHNNSNDHFTAYYTYDLS
ncbi:uncharacterized protein LOC128222454 [Mya arenaria]|uniref:uncharacterized protein LOC128222454 n=1 Tax=Mya arenaria TaxID=6604 RepID=UPI0022DFBAED|nr:uncharacterized protein LOC128222454 [Mya arenaria]